MGFSNGISMPLSLDPAGSIAAAIQSARVSTIENAVERQLDDWMKNADMMDKAIDDLGSINRWPRFCMLMVLLMDEETKDAAAKGIKQMVRAVLTDDAITTVMADMGLER